MKTQAALENIPPKLTKRMKRILLVFIAIPYIAFMGWCGFLLVIFPNRTGAFQELLFLGVISCLVGAGFFVVIAAIGLKRILRKGVPTRLRLLGSVRLILFLLPGLALAGMVPGLIMREPPLGIDITAPEDASSMIAPLPITFNLEQSIAVLERRGLRALSFSWDFDGDGEENDRTAVPEVTAIFDRPGAYNVFVIMELADGTTRRLGRRILIPAAVFSFSPLRPGVEEPVRFSVEHLIDDKKMIREVEWDFDDDGVIDLVAEDPEAVHTYLRTGKVKVRATLKLTNQTQRSYERVIEIFEPQPPPFPVEIISEPENLLGPAPFGTIFRVESESALEDVIWDFGDGEKTKGMRVGHTFKKKGAYQVTARVHSESGDVAQLSKVVRVVDSLRLSDLEFEGSPSVYKNVSLSGEVPVNVNLTPRTSMPLIDFRWEAPGATSIGSTDTNLQAIYRRPGKYDITLVAQDPDGKVLRHTLTLTVDPPATMVTIRMNPEGGIAPLQVRFDASETVIPGEEITGFEWVFGDSEDSPQQRGALVEHIFQKPGAFTVQLSAYTTSGMVYSAEKTIVVRAPVLDACVLPSRTSGEAPLGVSFKMDCTTGNPLTILWDFSDGAQSEERNPIHVFETPGVYKVTLSITDDLGSQSNEIVTITAE